MFKITNTPLKLALSVFVCTLLVGLAIFAGQFLYIGGNLTARIVARAAVTYGVVAVFASIVVYLVTRSFKGSKSRNKHE